MGTVTVNDKPLAEFVGAELADEIESVRRTENQFKGQRRHKSTYPDNLHRVPPTVGKVLYAHGQRETHVLIYGELFPWGAKAPFVRAGASVFGCIEYDEQTGKIKCHECGVWCHGIATHIRNKHGALTSKEYKVRYGLSVTTALDSPTLRAKRIAHAKRIGLAGLGTRFTPGHDGYRQKASGAASAEHVRVRAVAGLGLSDKPQWDNMMGRCMAQRREKLKAYCEQLGRAPTRRELTSYIDQHGQHILSPQSLRNLFGVSVAEVFKSIGYEARKPNCPLGPYKQIDMQLVRRLLSEGWAWQRVAKQVGVHVQTLQRRFAVGH